MKTKFIPLACLFLALLGQVAEAGAQATVFTYQGRLTENGTPANGSNDFTFTLYNAVTGGATVGMSNVIGDLAVSNGLFTATLDFGASALDGSARWLQIAVRPGASAGAYTNLAPRQPITATPYAVTAGNLSGSLSSAGLSGTYANAVTLNNVANSFSGSGANLTTLNASQLASGTLADMRLSANVALRGAANAFTGNQTIAGNVGINKIVPTTALDVNGTVTASGLSGNAGAPLLLGTTDNQPIEFNVHGVRVLRLEGNINGVPNIIGGSQNNVVEAGAVGATIAGGVANTVSGNNASVSGGAGNAAGGGAAATVGGGAGNAAQGQGATVAGGSGNNASGGAAAVGGGAGNTASGAAAAAFGGSGNNASGDNATVAGGTANAAAGPAAAVSGGSGNAAGGAAAAVGGGDHNTASGAFATVPGGDHNLAEGANSLAAGRRAKANHAGAFVWADSTDADFASTATNQFSIRALGGVRLSDDTPNLSFGSQTRQMLNLWGTQYGIGVQSDTLYFRCDANSVTPFAGFRWYKGGMHHPDTGNSGGGTEMMSLTEFGLYVRGTFVSLSDRNAKENFQPVDPRAVLDKVAALPLSEWNYKQDTGTRHIGPMAQDFHAAFHLGADDKHIATVDESGVALTAIQGLNQKLEADVKAKDARITALEERLSALETLLQK